MKRAICKLSLLFTLATATSAFAEVTVTSALRRVDLVNTPTPSTTKSTTATAGIFNDSISDSGGADATATSGSADQNTDIQPLVFGGTGSAGIVRHVDSPSFVLGSSSVLIYFTTDTFYDWSSSGTLSADVDGGFAYANLLNLDTSAYIFYKQTASGNLNVDLTAGDLLVPGHYQFYMEAQGSGTNGGDVESSAQFVDAFLTLTPTDTPEPSSLGLLAIGAAGLLCRARRRAS